MDWNGVASTPGLKDRWKALAEAGDRQIGCFLQFDPDLGATAAPSKGSGPLWGVPFAVKDNIAVRSFRLTCGSRMLRDFVSPYTATAVEKLQAAGAVVVVATVSWL